MGTIVLERSSPGTAPRRLLLDTAMRISSFGEDEQGELYVVDLNGSVSRIASDCSYSISPTSQSFAAAGGTGNVTVTAGGGCAWTAVSNASWIDVTSGASGTDNGIVQYSVDANASSSPRTGTLTIAGQTFTVSQSGAVACCPSRCLRRARRFLRLVVARASPLRRLPDAAGRL